ncbi:hypothetical protein GBA52_011317 [Prunus armeniaca]|nr:hypothetical protein GBA52_011317 [Prunus armeniaca]
MGCFVISKNTINLICIGGGESLMDNDNFEALRLKKDDLIGVKEVLEQCLKQCLPPHISLDKFYFFNMFNTFFDEFVVGIDDDQFVDKLITHPFLLSPRTRLEYGFTLGFAKETADICGGDYGKNLRHSFWKALDYKGRGYNKGVEELLRLLRNIYPHYVKGCNENVIDHYVRQVLCPGFLNTHFT